MTLRMKELALLRLVPTLSRHAMIRLPTTLLALSTELTKRRWATNWATLSQATAA